MDWAAKQFSFIRRTSKGQFIVFGFMALSCSVAAEAQVIEPPISPIQPEPGLLILVGPGIPGSTRLPDYYLLGGSGWMILTSHNVPLGADAQTILGGGSVIPRGGSLAPGSLPPPVSPAVREALGVAQLAQTHENAGQFNLALSD
ncbi:MAG: hypothetical protein HY301_19065 [Verrucomicrobia bacterium]|nr:hypothetical protein [Verrucomicrobiota bacterium]